jgi:hypothetical protein
MVRAARYLLDTVVRPIEERDDVLAVWSLPEVVKSNQPAKVKLGGVGLGLIALLSAEAVAPGTVPLDTLRKLGRFALYMQKEDGSFYSRYRPEVGGRDDSWTSLYYPGETALGLIMLYEKDPDTDWLQGAANAMAYLSRIREGREIVEADHWAILATARLMALYDKCEQPVPAAALLHHVAQICESILAEKPDVPANHVLYGCLRRDGSTCPTATRLEGMLAALTVLPEEEYADLRGRVRRASEQGIVFLMRSQIRSGEYRGGVPVQIFRGSISDPEEAAALEVRIDYVQHALSAMIQYDEMFFPSGEGDGASGHDQEADAR